MQEGAWCYVTIGMTGTTERPQFFESGESGQKPDHIHVFQGTIVSIGTALLQIRLDTIPLVLELAPLALDDPSLFEGTRVRIVMEEEKEEVRMCLSVIQPETQ